MILSCVNIKKSFGIDTILEDVTFLIEDNEKTAVVGANGAGKTTLFKIITEEISKDSGDVIYSKGTKSVGYLSQNIEINEELTISEALTEVFNYIINLEKEIRTLEKDMGIFDGEALKNVMDKYSKLVYEFEEKKGYEYKSRVIGVSKGLGFSEKDIKKQIKFLSGGEKTRVALGRLLLSNPDLLLLDEPTNHLDISSIEWLEDYLKSYEGAVLLISHDRYFINKIATKIIEVENGKANVYKGDYTNYSKEKELARKVQYKHFVEQQKEIKRQEDVIKTLRSYNREKSIKRAESREKMLDKMELVDKPESLPETMHFTITPKKSSGFDVLEVTEISKSFGTRLLFKDVSFSVKKGDKTAFVGPNGVGKTTVIRIILNQIEADDGKIKKGANVIIGYYDQEREDLNIENSILDEMIEEYPKLTVLEIRSSLAAFVFTGDDVTKKIKTLSGGERGRVALAKIMLSGANFLILDEPTNHLDIYSKEILEEALRSYEGTILYISHDRYFVNNTATKVLELSKTGITSYFGNYDYYLEKRQEEREEFLQTEESSGQKEWRETKEEQGLIRKKENEIKKTEEEIHFLEEAIYKLELELSLPEIATNHIRAEEVFKEKLEFEKNLDNLYFQWENLHN